MFAFPNTVLISANAAPGGGRQGSGGLAVHEKDLLGRKVFFIVMS